MSEPPFARGARGAFRNKARQGGAFRKPGGALDDVRNRKDAMPFSYWVTWSAGDPAAGRDEESR